MVVNYKKIKNNTWKLKVVKDGKTEDLMIEFPPDCLDQVGWDVGDTLIWEELPDGNWSIRKKEEDTDK